MAMAQTTQSPASSLRPAARACLAATVILNPPTAAIRRIEPVLQQAYNLNQLGLVLHRHELVGDGMGIRSQQHHVAFAVAGLLLGASQRHGCIILVT